MDMSRTALCDHLCVPLARVLDDPTQILSIDVHETEALTVAVRPLEVVEKTPRMKAPDLRPVRNRSWIASSISGSRCTRGRLNCASGQAVLDESWRNVERVQSQRMHFETASAGWVGRLGFGLVYSEMDDTLSL